MPNNSARAALERLHASDGAADKMAAATQYFSSIDEAWLRAFAVIPLDDLIAARRHQAKQRGGGSDPAER